MRQIILILLLFNAAYGFSQTPVPKKGLADFELVIAKEAYRKMLQSEAYKAEELHRSDELELLGNAKIEYDIENIRKIITREDARKYYNVFLTKNLAKTKFKSVKEGVDMFMKGLDLTEKRVNENVALFDLMRNATSEQLNEITAPRRQAKWEEFMSLRLQ